MMLAYQKFADSITLMISRRAKIVALIFVAYFATFYSKCTYFLGKKVWRQQFWKILDYHTLNNTFCVAQEIHLSHSNWLL